MLTPEQIKQIIKENESLQVQVNDLNYMLAEKETELAAFRKAAAENAELKSMLDMQLDEIHQMQNRIGKQQQQAAGAEEREFELQQELTDAAKLYHQYTDLLQQYTYASTQLTDLQEQMAALKKRNNMLQQIAVKIGEMESTVELLTLERDELLYKIKELEKLQTA